MKFVMTFIMSLSFILFPQIAVAEPSIEGMWRGDGYVESTSGERERVRCRVEYVQETPKVYRVSATCATASVRLSQTGQILKVRQGRYVGDFYNSEFDISGRIRILVRGNRQTVIMKSDSGSGRLSLRR